MDALQFQPTKQSAAVLVNTQLNEWKLASDVERRSLLAAVVHSITNHQHGGTNGSDPSQASPYNCAGTFL